MTTQCDHEFIRVAEQLADAARPIARRYFRAGVQVDQKADNTMVTTADREIETVMREIIGAAFPDHKICGEEQGGAVRGEGYQWVLDPIDGTSAFVMGAPTFGTLIALARDGVPILGVIDAFNDVAKQARSVRYGADCYGFGLVAMGCVDLVVEASLKPWDYAAVIPVVCEAGGIVTDWCGAPITLQSDGHVLAAGGPTCHAAALSILAAA